MLNLPVYNESGQQVASESIDPALLGGEVNVALLKQAVVMFHTNTRQGTFGTLSRGMVEGSTRKIYRQKGTGRARMGSVRSVQRRGGGRAFRKDPRDFRLDMPRQMRRLARNHAVLSKIKSGEAAIVEGLRFDAPKTKRFADMLGRLGAERGCVFATKGVDANVYKSGRNIPRTEITNVADLNARQVLLRPKLIFTRDAFAAFKETLAARESAAKRQKAKA